MNGRGRFVVTAVGDATEIGKVARSSSEKSAVKTPLTLQLDRLGKLINKFGFSLSILSAVLFLGCTTSLSTHCGKPSAKPARTTSPWHISC